MRPYRRAGGVTAGKTTTAGTVRRAGGRECTTSKLRRMRAVTRRAPNCRASRRTHQKGGNVDGHLGPGSVRPSPLPTFRQRKRSQRTLRGRCFPAGRDPCRWPNLPHAGHVNGSKSLRFAKSSPWRPGSAGAPTAVFAQLWPSAPGLDSVPLLAQWQLSTNSPAPCLSITANGLRKRLDSPALCGANEQFYRSSTSAKKSTQPK